MKFAGAIAIWWVYEAFLIWFACKSSVEAYYVIRGREMDRKGDALWFYRRNSGLPVIAKNRMQALVLTISVAVAGFALGVPPLIRAIIRIST